MNLRVRIIRNIARFCALTVILAACGRESTTPVSASADSVLINNVTIVDGTGSPAYAADVRMAGGRIVAIGDLDVTSGDLVIDGGGLTLAPGFIDSHSHASRELLDHDDALAVTSQGITTVVVGQDGGSAYPLADYFRSIEDKKVAVNVASYAGHNTLRDSVLGADFQRAATEDEIAEMSTMLRHELASGALGLSTGLEYDPGIYSARSEVMALAQVAADAGTRYISHVRSEDRWFEDALDEIIEIGRVTGMPVQVSHIKLAMKRLWGQAPQILAKLDAAREAGIDITADLYPYEFWQSNLMVLLPERDFTDRAAVDFALQQIAPPDGLWMTQFDPNPEYVGMTLTEIAAQMDVDTTTAFMQLAAQSVAMQEETGDAADSIIGTSMIEDDIRALLAWPETNICTDGGLVDLHPRSHGSFPKVLGRYVREERLISLEQAIHKMSGLTARHLGFDDRGTVKVGNIADLVLFDPASVADRATPAEPNLLSTGIAAVWVAGQQVYANGAATSARPGVVIRHIGTPKPIS
jgi:N-acyl-D-amino-acid deacylase